MSVTADGTRKVSTGRSILLLGGKLLIAAGAIYWLVSSNRLDLSKLVGHPRSGSLVPLLSTGMVCTTAGLSVLAIRLRILLAHVGLVQSFGRCLALTSIGAFFASFLPGLVAGDLVKALYLGAGAPGQRMSAFATIIMDRLIGLYSLFLLGTLALTWAVLSGRFTYGWLMMITLPTLTVLGTCSFCVLPLSPLIRCRVFTRRWHILPHNVQSLMTSVGRLGQAPRLMALCILLSLLNHALVVATFIVADQLLGRPIPWISHFATDPLAMTLNMLPFSPGGIGLTEGAFSLLYESMGSADGAAVGLLGRAIQYSVFAWAGLASLLVTRLSWKPGAPDLRSSKDRTDAPRAKSYESQVPSINRVRNTS